MTTCEKHRQAQLNQPKLKKRCWSRISHLHSNHTSVNDFKWSCAESVQQSLVSRKNSRFWLICIDSELFRSFPLGFSLETVPGGPIVIHFHQILSSGMLFWILFKLNSWFLEVPWGSLRFPEVPSDGKRLSLAYPCMNGVLAYACTHMHACICICMHMHAYACLHMHACIRMHACMRMHFFIINQKRWGATFDTKQVLKLCCNN